MLSFTQLCEAQVTLTPPGGAEEEISLGDALREIGVETPNIELGGPEDMGEFLANNTIPDVNNVEPTTAREVVIVEAVSAHLRGLNTEISREVERKLGISGPDED